MSAEERSKQRVLAARRRNAALVRVDSARRWIIGGAVALTCALAALVQSLAPGHSVAAASAATAPSSGGSTSPASGTSGNSGNTGASSGYIAPSTQPVAPVISGGS